MLNPSGTFQSRDSIAILKLCWWNIQSLSELRRTLGYLLLVVTGYFNNLFKKNVSLHHVSHPAVEVILYGNWWVIEDRICSKWKNTNSSVAGKRKVCNYERPIVSWKKPWTSFRWMCECTSVKALWKGKWAIFTNRNVIPKGLHARPPLVGI